MTNRLKPIPAGDWWGILTIGAGVGLLIQMVLTNLLHHPSLELRAGVFLIFLILAPAALFIAHLIARVFTGIYRFAKFAAVGSLNAFVDLGILNLELYLLHSAPTTILYATFKGISFLISTANSFLWNRNWTFGSQQKASVGEAVKFYAVTLVAFAFNVSVATLVVKFVSHAGVPVSGLLENGAAVTGIIAALFINFTGYKYFVFKK